MQFTFGTTSLAGTGITGPFGVSINGTQINDDTAFFRAVANGFFPRGNRTTKLVFSVTWTFNDVATAEVFMCDHFGSLSQQATLFIVCGGSGSGSAVNRQITNAVLEDIEFSPLIGLTLVAKYTFAGGLIAGSSGPVIPTLAVQRGHQALNAADVSATVTFSPSFGSTPIVVVGISGPSGGTIFSAEIDLSTLSTTGFTANFSLAVPGAGYYLDWIAVY